MEQWRTFLSLLSASSFVYCATAQSWSSTPPSPSLPGSTPSDLPSLAATDSSTGNSPTQSLVFHVDPPRSWTVFKTEPLVRPEHFDVVQITSDRSSLAPGYIFVDPIWAERAHGLGPWGPEIYAQDGTLIYHGQDGLRAQDFHVCDFLGEQGTHLCYHERLDREDWPSASQKYHIPAGRKVILDHHYTPVGHNHSEGVRGFGPNGHEFNMLGGGHSFLQPISLAKQVDLAPYGGDEDGWVEEMCFQEIDVESGTSTFEWCWLDHLPLSQSNLYPPSFGRSSDVSSGKAFHGTRESPWDFAHFNSMDKNLEGDYLVSVRHCDTIVKVAGKGNRHGAKSGTVLWQLGGQATNFTMDFTFSKQHSIRFISTGTSETVVSILDNAGEGNAKASAPFSSGKIIRVNNETMHADLIREYRHPEGLQTPGKGNLQILSNGNAIVGWGLMPALSEFSEDGTVLYHARYTANLSGTLKAEGYEGLESSYRAFKFPWVGKPMWKPKLVAYSRTCIHSRTSPLMAYVSWNGATEVVKWRFKTANNREGPWFQVADFPKNGFETAARLTNSITERLSLFAPWVAAEALNQYGTVIGKVEKMTYVPTADRAKHCKEYECLPDDFDYEDTLNDNEKCVPKQLPLYVLICFYFIVVESTVYLSRLTCYLALTSRDDSARILLEEVELDEAKNSSEPERSHASSL